MNHIRSLLTVMHRQIITPPHYVGIESSKLLIVDSFNFSANPITAFDGPIMSANDFKIESSMDGKTWNTLYIGSIPNITYTFDIKCEFNPTYCKYIRCTILTTYWNRDSHSFGGCNFKIYGTLVAPVLYTNPDAYGIHRKNDTE